MNDNYIMKYSLSDFVVKISPTFSKENKWTGEVNIDVLTPNKKNVGKDVYMGVDRFVKMMLCSIPVMETNSKVQKAIFEYTFENYPEIFDDDYEDDEDVIIERGEDNIINLTFKSKTDGSA